MERTICDCNQCKAACSYKPGWLKFGEEEILAKSMNITVQELFDKHLLVDWYQDLGKNGESVFVLSPTVVSKEPGQMFDYNPKGKCVFFKDGGCEIHSASPFECRTYIHSESSDVIHSRHREVAETWNNPDAQKLIEKLLGEKPYETESGSIFGFF